MNLGMTIRRRREELGLTQGKVATRAGISKPYLSNIETGKTRNPPADRVLHKLEKALRLHPGDLTRLAHLARTPVDVREALEMREAEIRKLRGLLRDPGGSASASAALEEGFNDCLIPLASAGALVPIINSVAAGYPHEFTDLDYPPSVADDYLRCPDLRDPQAFAARVVGDSMEPDYREGDIVVFSPNTPAENGNDCFVRFDGDGGTTFKRYYLDDDGVIRLQPLNSRYPAQTYPAEQVTGLWPAIFRIERLRDL